MSGPLFPSLVSGSRGPSSRHLVEFRAGKMMQKGSTVYPDKRKGLVYVQHSDDSLIHFCWKDRTTGDVEDDLIIFPDDCEFKRVKECTTGRVYVLKFKTGPKRLFFWMQEPKTDRDEEHCRKLNEYIHNPPGAPGGGGAGGGHDLSALGGEGALQTFLENMTPQQLMQMISSGQGGLTALGALAGPGGLASLLGSGGQASSSSSSSGSSSSSSSRSASESSGTTPWPPQASTTSPPAASSTASPTGGHTPTPPGAFAFGQPPNTPNQPIQLSDLQNILATMNSNGSYTPASAQGGSSSGADLASACTPEMMAPILCSADVQQILMPLLPSGESLPQSPEELGDASTPQFQQAMSLFAVALASGQLGPLLGRFGLPQEAVDAANRGDLGAFANAVENSNNKGGDSKDKKDEDEDNMSLD